MLVFTFRALGVESPRVGAMKRLLLPGGGGLPTKVLIRAAAIFAEFDKNESGFLFTAEILAMIDNKGEAKNLTRQLDRDGDAPHKTNAADEVISTHSFVTSLRFPVPMVAVLDALVCKMA